MTSNAGTEGLPKVPTLLTSEEWDFVYGHSHGPFQENLRRLGLWGEMLAVLEQTTRLFHTKHFTGVGYLQCEKDVCKSNRDLLSRAQAPEPSGEEG